MVKFELFRDHLGFLSLERLSRFEELLSLESFTFVFNWAD